MKFYRNDDDENFEDIFSHSGSEGSDEQDSFGKDTKAKKEKDFTVLIPDKVEIAKDKINVKVNRNENVIESIDIECECGNSIKLVIDYENE